MASGVSEHDPGMGTYVGIWAGFLAIAGIEVLITYQRHETKHLLFILLILAAIEALVGMLYCFPVNPNNVRRGYSVTLCRCSAKGRTK